MGLQFTCNNNCQIKNKCISWTTISYKEKHWRKYIISTTYINVVASKESMPSLLARIFHVIEIVTISTTEYLNVEERTFFIVYLGELIL